VSNNVTSRISSRTSRIEAKYKGHRSEDRFFAARNDAKQACENLRTAIRKSQIHTVMRDELLQAADRAEALVKGVEPTQIHPGAEIRQLAKEIEHLQLAEQWVAAADRVLNRLRTEGPAAARTDLEQAQDAVMWCVRAGEWNGQLTAAGTQLQKVVAEGEIHAARVN
jgi:nitrogenase subunit NifH